MFYESRRHFLFCVIFSPSIVFVVLLLFLGICWHQMHGTTGFDHGLLDNDSREMN
jgi:hypothetical protein